MAVNSLVRRFQRRQLVEGNSEAIDVRSAVAAALKPFRRHVKQCPDDLTGNGQLFAPLVFGQAEVGDPDLALRIEQQIRRLDVTMKNALLMGIFKRIGDLHADAPRCESTGPRFASRGSTNVSLSDARD